MYQACCHVTETTIKHCKCFMLSVLFPEEAIINIYPINYYYIIIIIIIIIIFDPLARGGRLCPPLSLSPFPSPCSRWSSAWPRSPGPGRQRACQRFSGRRPRGSPCQRLPRPSSPSPSTSAMAARLAVCVWLQSVRLGPVLFFFIRPSILPTRDSPSVPVALPGSWAFSVRPFQLT